VDLAPTQLSLTWWNGRSGNAGISKRLDRFLVDGNLLSSLNSLKSWTINSDISDHNPICMQFFSARSSAFAPYKFNSTWITDMDFRTLIHTTWDSMQNWSNNFACVLLCENFQFLKKQVISGQKGKKHQQKVDLTLIETSLSKILESQ